MKEAPIIMSTPMVQAILDGHKTMTRRVVNKNTSETIGDWSNFCWDGSANYIDDCGVIGHPKERINAPLPSIDRGFPDPVTGKKNYQYLHVPYRWAEDCTVYRIYPIWDIGDRLWVRESWASQDFCICNESDLPNVRDKNTGGYHTVIHKAGKENYAWGMLGEPKWKPSIHMFKRSARIWLEITDIRVERLQDITIKDIIDEGTPDFGPWPINTAMLITNTNNIDDLQRELSYGMFIDLWDKLNAKRGYSWESNPWVWVVSFEQLDKELS